MAGGKVLKNSSNKSGKNDFDKIVSEVKSERDAAPELSPLEDEYDMLAGYVDEEGTLHNTFVIRPMTGADEEELARFKNSSMARLITVILERCVTRIGTLEKSEIRKNKWHEIISNLYVADQDYMMMRIRETSIGNMLSIVHTCAECKTSITTELTVDELKVIEWDGEEGIQFTLPRGFVDKDGNVHREGIIKYPRGIDRESVVPIAQRNAPRARHVMLARLVQFDDGTQITEKDIQSLTLGDLKYLTKILDSNQFGLDMNIEVECPNCGNTFTGGLTVTNFI